MHRTFAVMPGIAPGMHVLPSKQGVDGRDNLGYDGLRPGVS